MGKAWWQDRPLRIYHPNTREAEMGNLDIKRFVDGCLAINAEAVVFSAGGIFAFYPSEVPYHFVSPVIGKRDLLGEFVKEARARGLRVIARMDFSKARDDVNAEHPEWFMRDAEDRPDIRPKSSLRSTCPVAGYQNEAFGHKVLKEISERYGVDGFHLNAGGFHNFFCYCDACRTSFGQLIPKDPQEDPELWYRFLRWRVEAYAQQLASYYRVIRESNPNSFFTAELPGPEYTEWGGHGGYHLPALRDSFSQLVRTTGGMRLARSCRWWPGLTVDQIHALGKNAIVNIKFNMRDLNLTQTIMPPAEFAFNAYQAIAHGAGLKLCTFSIPENLLDRRPLPTIAQVFGFMRRQREVLDSSQPVIQVVLVWPERALIKNYASGSSTLGSLRGEVVGLYAAMRSRHILLGILYDEQLSSESLKAYGAVVLPTAVWLEKSEAEAFAGYVRAGGRLILLDSPAAFPDVQVKPVPQVLSEISGIRFTDEINQMNYALFADVFGSVGSRPDILKNLGAIALSQPYRRVEIGSRTQVWMRGVQSDDPASTEQLGMLEAAGDPLLVKTRAGEGDVLYFASGLGQMFTETGHGDYAKLLEAMIFDGIATLPPLLTNAPSSVGVNLAHWTRGLVVHLVNGAGPAPLDETAPLGPIELNLECKGGAKVTLRTPEKQTQELTFDKHGDRIIVSVPSLGAYSQVVVESD
jgi:hypothetical protein